MRTKRKQNYTTWLLLSLLCLTYTMQGCIPIEDRFPPNIGTLNISDSYNWGDTLELATVLTDNSSLASALITIKAQSEEGNSWRVNHQIPLEGRRFDLNYSIVIPMRTILGQYVLELEVVDGGGNVSRKEAKFTIGSDVRAPRFENLFISNLPRRPNADNQSYLGCRLDALSIVGEVIDSNGIVRLTAKLGNLPEVLRLFEPAETFINLEGIFDGALRIPNNIANGTDIPLILRAVDRDGNEGSQTLIIRVECDDEAPQIRIIRTSPPLNEDREVRIVQGGKFSLLETEISDNQFLDRLFIRFGRDNEALEEILNLELNTSETVNLEELLGEPFSITIPEEARPGDVYILSLRARDSAQNVSSAQRIRINVMPDLPPVILISNLLINGQERTYVPEQVKPLSPNSSVRIEGKIEEDVSFEYIRIAWGRRGALADVVNLNEADLEGKTPFNLADPASQNVFRVPQDATAGQIYELQIKAKDLRNPEVSKTLLFRVE
ncbi:MAG: DUF4625 domain-containing protein [Bernardetiaceae bacterium]|nr:DUF4625 domain-containing protein [Bernardetiaceae bacterium]